jgi:hypothetical protein
MGYEPYLRPAVHPRWRIHPSRKGISTAHRLLSRHMTDLPEHVARNRSAWDACAPSYVERGREQWERNEPNWGIYGVPEAEVEMLPARLEGLDAVELGLRYRIRLLLARPPRRAAGRHRQLAGAARQRRGWTPGRHR